MKLYNESTCMSNLDSWKDTIKIKCHSGTFSIIKLLKLIAMHYTKLHKIFYNIAKDR